jgi:hypothetical protein
MYMNNNHLPCIVSGLNIMLLPVTYENWDSSPKETLSIFSSSYLLEVPVRSPNKKGQCGTIKHGWLTLISLPTGTAQTENQQA